MSDLVAQLNDQKRKVDFDSFDITVKELVAMVDDNLINIAPEYQRHFRWDANREATFIESVFLGIPIPSLFMAANSDGTWELIDGVQRLSTLIHFLGKASILNVIEKQTPLELTGLQKLTRFNNTTFEELPKSVQLQFLLKPLKVTTISDKSDFHVRFDLFERLNTGGILLTQQEIRACIYRGKFNETLRVLSEEKDFKKAVKLPKESEANGTREELVLRFFAFYHCYEKFDHSVRDFLSEYMVMASKEFDYDENIALFRKVFSLLTNALPHGINRSRTTTPTNLYEAVTVGAALALRTSGNLNLDNIQEWIQSPELTKLTTGATNSRSMVKGRLFFARNRFLS